MVRAKFTVTHITTSVGSTEIIMAPVTQGSPENDSFYKYTPYGAIQLGTVNKHVAEKFTPGQEVYVDFTPVED